MHPIFFTWNGDYDSLVSTGFYSHGLRTRTVAVKHGSAYAGVVEANTPAIRSFLSNLDVRLCVMPGPHGNVNATQAAAINAIAPSLNVKEGDAFATTLSHVYKLYSDEQFNPDNY